MVSDARAGILSVKVSIAVAVTVAGCGCVRACFVFNVAVGDSGLGLGCSAVRWVRSTEVSFGNCGSRCGGPYVPSDASGAGALIGDLGVSASLLAIGVPWFLHCRLHLLRDCR